MYDAILKYASGKCRFAHHTNLPSAWVITRKRFFSMHLITWRATVSAEVFDLSKNFSASIRWRSSGDENWSIRFVLKKVGHTTVTPISKGASSVRMVSDADMTAAFVTL